MSSTGPYSASAASCRISSRFEELKMLLKRWQVEANALTDSMPLRERKMCVTISVGSDSKCMLEDFAVNCAGALVV
jgi:hypothetical protein